MVMIDTIDMVHVIDLCCLFEADGLVRLPHKNNNGQYFCAHESAITNTVRYGLDAG